MKMLFNKLRVMEVLIEDTDKCLNCKNQKLCPLFHFIKSNEVILRFGKIDIKSCGLFKQKK